MELSPVFARRLYLALLVESLDRPNVPKLIEKTGWPRRTIQDVLKALPGIGIELMFVQDGRRHNDGYYQLSDWGPFDSQWVLERKGDIAISLGFSAQASESWLSFGRHKIEAYRYADLIAYSHR